jgi:hypothetical protein
VIAEILLAVKHAHKAVDRIQERAILSRAIFPA